VNAGFVAATMSPTWGRTAFSAAVSQPAIER
jgi:hypothetical protein